MSNENPEHISSGTESKKSRIINRGTLTAAALVSALLGGGCGGGAGAGAGLSSGPNPTYPCPKTTPENVRGQRTFSEDAHPGLDDDFCAFGIPEDAICAMDQSGEYDIYDFPLVDPLIVPTNDYRDCAIQPLPGDASLEDVPNS